MAIMQKKKQRGRAPVYAAIIVILIVAIAASIYLNAVSVKAIAVSAPLNATIGSAPSIFSIKGNEYAMYVSGAQGGNVAYVNIAQFPTMVKPMLYVKLTLHNTTKINAGSNYTTIEIRLNSISNKSIGVTIIPISASLLIAPDSASIKTVYVGLGGPAGSISIHTNYTSTTIASSTTTATTSTTSISAQVNQTQVEIQNLLNKDKFYPLVMNFSKLYSNTSSCTLQSYDTAYVGYYGSTPSGTYTYQNVSQFTPYNMLESTIGQHGLYITNFVALTRSSFYNNTSALKITMNVTSGIITNTTLGGVYAGLSYATLQNLYKEAVVIGGPCGIYVAH
ncbi:MAG: hypothetical protein M1360_00170 [Candidatus Marsarchaeota archaeon]|jgi:hypothetical protein|nr:hypothetical protein [Candidatus Marsarchaeota archaeon]MCL5418344.1 hypothetical protein [Candidatus Marsarchaeota archaeon]